METLLGLIGPALFGAGTGGIGLIFGGISRAFTWWTERKEKADEHKRVIELTQLQYTLRSQEKELEHEIAMDGAAVELRRASYEHDSKAGKASQWVVDTLRMVRPSLTGALIILLAAIYFTSDATQQLEIVAAVIYMATSAVTWWFGDRMTQRKK
jgi:Flp pilus assembly protein TadB